VATVWLDRFEGCRRDAQGRPDAVFDGVTPESPVGASTAVGRDVQDFDALRRGPPGRQVPVALLSALAADEAVLGGEHLDFVGGRGFARDVRDEFRRDIRRTGFREVDVVDGHRATPPTVSGRREKGASGRGVLGVQPPVRSPPVVRGVVFSESSSPASVESPRSLVERPVCTVVWDQFLMPPEFSFCMVGNLVPEVDPTPACP